MKVFHNIFPEIIKIENILKVWQEFKSGKANKIDVISFERNLEDNLFELFQELKEKNYKHSPYWGFKISDPKPRNIHKAEIKDRIVHYLISKELERIYESTFFPWSYSSRKGKGIHKALRDLIKTSRKLSGNYTRNFYYLKCDIKKFFDSIDHQVLIEILKKKIKDKDFLWLLDEIIRSFHSELGRNKGIPLGNLTSQYFANIYLNQLDCFIKQDLKIKFYFRYADDFLILDKGRKALEDLLLKISKFLKEKLSLKLHPERLKIGKFSWGIDFVGYIILPHYILPRIKTKRRALERMKEQFRLFQEERIGLKDIKATIDSYLGLLKHCDSYEFQRELKNQIIFYEKRI